MKYWTLELTSEPDVQGIKSNSTTITIQNLREYPITLHDSSALSAPKYRLSIGLSIKIRPKESIQLFYCREIGRWKVCGNFWND